MKNTASKNVLYCRDLAVGYKGKSVLAGLNLAFESGHFISLLGPNGAGKTTLLLTLSRHLQPLGGHIEILGKPLATMPSLELARIMAVVLTDKISPPLFKVFEFIALGRYPHTDFLGRLKPIYTSKRIYGIIGFDTVSKSMSWPVNQLHGLSIVAQIIVTMQQTYGRVSGVKETIAPEQLMEDAFNLNSGALIRHPVEVKRAYEAVAPITVDKHKVLQILLNLINNAKYACTDSGNTEKSSPCGYSAPALTACTCRLSITAWALPRRI